MFEIDSTTLQDDHSMSEEVAEEPEPVDHRR
jgi:hypothetical protein